ncbi:hypothetical protein M569_03368, partial [Genlisea aurea]
NSDDREVREEEQSQNQNTLPLIPPASISLSLSTLLPAHFFPPKPIAAAPAKLKIPSQIPSLANISLASSSSSSSSPSRASFRSATSANPLQKTLTPNPLRPSNPSGAAPLRRATIVWFRNDLRVHDNECLASANDDSISVLPVYLFDPRDYGKSSSGFDKTGPYRANFLIESVADLRDNLRSRGSDLIVRIGKPEKELPELARSVGADAVYAHREVSHDEVRAEEKIEEAMKDEGVEVKYFWGSTLYHLDDLPFELENMPANYGGFKEKVRGLNVRDTIQCPEKLNSLPKRGDVEAGEIPTLLDLGLGNSLPATRQNVGGGGETEALNRLRSFASESNPKRDNQSVYGTNFSCKISPWLAMGCLSPRSMFDELKKSASGAMAGVWNKKGDAKSDTGMNWLTYELLWRDFFRFITRKYSSKKQLSYEPATAACT